MSKEELVSIIIDELSRQGQEERMWTPYVDAHDPAEVNIDGRVDITAVADAILAKLEVKS